MRRMLVAGNWKMNGSRDSDRADRRRSATANPDPAAEIVVCPPATLIAPLAGHGVAVGGQDCHPEPKGAHTGDISAEMLREAGAVAVILGHSERRADHGETTRWSWPRPARRGAPDCSPSCASARPKRSATPAAPSPSSATRSPGSIPEGATPARLVVAYEPVWAIGTGRTPTIAEIGEVHGFIRSRLADRFGAGAADGIRILYGGSVKASNAAEIFAVADVDGALVGGGAEDFNAHRRPPRMFGRIARRALGSCAHGAAQGRASDHGDRPRRRRGHPYSPRRSDPGGAIP
jgi:triosephosphate isomerase (TIM)